MSKIFFYFFIFLILQSSSLILASGTDSKQKVFAMYNKYHSKFSGLPDIETTKAKLLTNNKTAILVDVRSKQERDISIIPNSISKEEFQKLNSKEVLNKKIIVYCTIGYRSGKFASQPRKKGLDAYNLKGSLLGWIFSGEKLVNQQGKITKKIHVYGSDWNISPKGFNSVW